MKRGIMILGALALLSFAAAPFSALAQSSEALPFLRIDRDPVSAAMGFAGAASTGGSTAYSSFRNSAVIPMSSRTMDLGFSFQNWAPDGVKSTNLNFGGAYKISDQLGFSVGGAVQNGEEYSVFDASGNSKGTFKPSDMIVGGGLGFKITESLSVGANARYASQKLSEGDSYSAFCADAFVLYSLGSVNLAAGVASIGSGVKDSQGQSFDLPASATFAADYSAVFSEVHGLEMAADADYFFSGNFTVALGAQYSFKDMVFLRAGYHLGSDEAVLPSFVTLGAGVKFAGVSLNLAYLTANEVIGNTITAGLSYSF